MGILPAVARTDETGQTPAQKTLTRQALNTVAGLGVVAALGYALSHKGVIAKAEPVRLLDVSALDTSRVELCGQPSPDGRPVIVSMLYSDPKLPWIQQAANRFARLCPNIQIKLTIMNDVASAEAILNGEEAPTVWSPTDDIIVEYLEARWRQRSSVKLFNDEDRISLVRSPLVLLVWLDRLNVLDATLQAERSDEGAWMRSWCPLVPRAPALTKMARHDMVPGSWIDWYGPIAAAVPKKPAPIRRKDKDKEEKPAYEAPFPTSGDIRDWGRVKFAHTAPTRSASGLEALYLMAYDYVLPPAKRAPFEGKDKAATKPAALREAFESAFEEQKGAMEQWMRRCEAGLADPPSTTRKLTEEMFNVGPSRYDAVATFEHLTFPILDRIADNDGVLRNLRVVYPEPTFVNNHPAVILWPEATDRKKPQDAARKWVAFLRTKEMQEKAIEFGFRPGPSELSIRAYDVDTNPFLRMRRYGIVFDAPLVEPPRLDGAALQELMRLWGDATGRN